MANYIIAVAIVLVIIVIAMWGSPNVRKWLFIGAMVGLVGAATAKMAGGRSGDYAGSAFTIPKLKLKLSMKDVLRNAGKGIKSVVSGVAVAGTVGMGGDTVVEILSIVLDSALWLGQLGMVFLNGVGEAGPTLQKIWDMDFAGGVNAIHDRMRVIVAEAGGPTSAVFAEMRRVYSDTIDWLLSLLGTAISACIPDDAGTVGWAISELLIMTLRTGSANAFWAAQSVYNALPEIARAFLEKPESLRDLAMYAIESVEKYILHGKEDKWWQTITKSIGRKTLITTATFGVLLLNPILMFPVAGTIFLSGQLAESLYTADFGPKQLSAVLHALYEKPVQIPGIGTMTAIDAMVMFIRKITVLAFAGLYILSDNAGADSPPGDFKPPSIADVQGAVERVLVPPAKAANVDDPTGEQIDQVAASA